MTKKEELDFDSIAEDIVTQKPLHRIIPKLAVKSHYNNYSKKIIERLKPFSFICACTCESLLSRSHFISYILLNSLSCMNSLIPYRLSSGHDFEDFYVFKGSVIEDEPLFKVVPQPIIEIEIQKKYEFTILDATKQILTRFSKRHYLHPYKVYWYLVKKANVDIETASTFHSSQGVVRLCISYLLALKKLDPFKIDVNTIISNYSDLEDSVREANPTVLPNGVTYGFNNSFSLLNSFYSAFKSKFYISYENDKVFLFGRIINFSIQVLRLSSEYESKVIKENLNSLVSMIDESLSEMKAIITNKKIADYYFFDRWRSKCKIFGQFKSTYNKKPKKNISIPLFKKRKQLYVQK
ncbi:MAG: hypothetical protein K8R68_02290 [Bacteroidales bacterium]|nr:hypothetical protein [Bacteroidales bacterium]